MSVLIYSIGGLVALILLTVGVRMKVRRNQVTDLEPDERPEPRQGTWFTASLRTLVRRHRGPLDDAQEGPGRVDPAERDRADLDEFPDAAPVSSVVDPALTSVTALPEPSSVLPPGFGRPIAWLKGVQGIALDVLLTQEKITMGRDTQCNIVLDEETVSRRHCTLVFRSGRWYIRPFRAPNGTYVNDKLAPPESMTPLKSRDSIRIGPDVVLKITMPEVEWVAMELRTGAATSAGSRDQNQDNYLATPTIVGVADGVGGRPAGGLASKIAIDMLRGAPASLSLSQFMPAISAAVRARSADDPDTKNMATTLDAVQLVPEDGGYRMFGVHIGDGFALVDDGTQIRQLTTPHTLGAELARQSNPASARHPERAGLVRAIGLHDKTEVDAWSEPALIGSRFVLTTDGLISALGLKKFFQVLGRMRGDDPQQVADTVIGYAERHSGDSVAGLDNLTIVVADIVEQLAAEPGPSDQSAPAAISGTPQVSLAPPSRLTISSGKEN